MNNKMLLNLGLLAFVLALAAIAFLEPGKEEPKVLHLTEVDTESATRVELQNRESLVFEKRDGHWWLTSPFTAPANDIRVHQLLEIPRSESEAQYPLNSGELAKFELDKPKAILTIGSAQLKFGGSDPLDMRRYVQVGDTLNLVNDDFFHHLSASATDFVDKKLLPDDALPNEIVLPGLTAKQGADSQWSVEPASDAAAGINDLVTAWRGARAIEVKRVDQPVQGETVRIGFVSRPAVEFVIVQREPDLLLTRNDWGLQYLLSAESGKQLLNLQKPQPAPAADPTSPQEDEDESGGDEFEDMEPPVDEEGEEELPQHEGDDQE